MKKLTLAILMFAMLLSTFVACSKDNGKDGETTGAVVSDPVYGDDLPADLRFEGEEFTFATYEGGNIGEGWACFFDVDEPEAGNILEEAAYNRNVEVEERLGVTINCEMPWLWDGTGNGIVFVHGTCGLAGKDIYQTFFLESFHSYEVFIIDELIEDIAAMPYIDLDKPYYNKKANDVYYLGENLYFFVSDITYACQNAAQVLVNKDMLVDLGYDENYLYEKVEDGTWTLDVIFEMIDGLSSDLNSDGVMDHNDRWGLSGQPVAARYLFPAAGLKGTYLTEDGFAFDYGTDYAVEVMERIFDLYEHPDTWYDHGENWSNAFTSFWAGNSLFTCYASAIRVLQDIEFDFGILPFPKFREEQETYYADASGGYAMIPCTIENRNMVGAVIEAMASGSGKYFVPAFYENFIELGVIRDDYSRENWRRLLTEWSVFEFTRCIAPDERVRNYGPAYTIVGTGSREYASTWDAQKEMIAEICQEFYDWYLAD